MGVHLATARSSSKDPGEDHDPAAPGRILPHGASAPHQQRRGSGVNSDKQSLDDFVSGKDRDVFGKARAFHEFLSDVAAKGYTAPYLQTVSGPSANVAALRGHGSIAHVIQMNTANYLGLASHPQVIQAAQRALEQYGASMCGVPLIAGTTELHRLLEVELAEFKGVDAVCLFQTGYSANTGGIAALAGRHDCVVVDECVHASILEGARLAGSRVVSFRHSDCNHLDEVLTSVRRECDAGVLVVIEGVYGLDGDVPPAPEIVRVVRSHDARLMVDDCHATGVLGRTGVGLTEEYNLLDGIDVVMDSLSKAFGSIGGLIGASSDVVDYLRYFARPVSFSVGLSPVSVAAALAALRLIRSNAALVSRVQANAEFLRTGLAAAGVENVKKSRSAIMSVLVGDELKVRKMTAELFADGLWIEGIPYPAVPKGQERLRLRVNARHTESDLARALELLVEALHRHNVV
jgi:8-amino-7-oxononanoate synthase